MRFQCCLIPSLEPNSPKRFLHFRAIQGHSGGTFVDPTLQDNVLIPEDFAEYIYHIGNVTDMHSITNSGPIPGGKSLRKERQCVFFTAVNTMDEHRFPENARYDLDKARIVADKNEWKVRQNAVNWCNLKLAHKRGLQFYQNRSHASQGRPRGIWLLSISNQNTHNLWVDSSFHSLLLVRVVTWMKPCGCSVMRERHT